MKRSELRIQTTLILRLRARSSVVIKLRNLAQVCIPENTLIWSPFTPRFKIFQRHLEFDNILVWIQSILRVCVTFTVT